MSALIEIDELECPECGGALTAYCYEHGRQDEALQTGKTLQCAEWRYADGKPCHVPLDIICRDGCKREVKF